MRVHIAAAAVCCLLLGCVNRTARAEVVPGGEPDASVPPEPVKPAPRPLTPLPTPLPPPKTGHEPGEIKFSPDNLNIDEPGFKASVRPAAPKPDPAAAAPGTAPEASATSFAPRKKWSAPEDEDQPAGAGGTSASPEATISPALAAVLEAERRGAKSADVIRQLEGVLEREPSNTEAVYRLGVAYARAGQLEPALNALQKALQADGRNPKYACDYGLVLLRAGNIEGALNACRSAAVQAPAVARYHSATGDCLLAARRHAEAAESYKRAYMIEPRNAEYVFNYGLAHMNMKLFKQAIEIFDEAIKIDPKNPNFYCSRGVALENQKRVREALACYNRALEVDKKCAYAHYLIARVYSDPEDPTFTSSREAVEHANLAVKYSNGKNAEYLMGLARALRVSYNYEQAVMVARQAIQLDPRPSYEAEAASYEKLRTEGYFEPSK